MKALRLGARLGGSRRLTAPLSFRTQKQQERQHATSPTRFPSSRGETGDAPPPRASSSSRKDLDASSGDDEGDDVFERRRRLYWQTKKISSENVGIQRAQLQRRGEGLSLNNGNDDESDVKRRAAFDLELLLLGLPILLVASPWLLAHPLASLVALTALFTLPGSGRAMRSLARESAALLSSSSRTRRMELRGGGPSRALPRGRGSGGAASGSSASGGGGVFDPRRRPAATTPTPTTTQQQQQVRRLKPLPPVLPPSQDRR